MSGPAPGSPEWLSIVTASKAGAIIGVSPWQSPYALWMEMKGRSEPRQQTTAMSRGNYLEPAILAWWRDRRPPPEYDEHVYQEQVWHTHEGWAGATVDAETEWSGEKVIVEAKSAARMDEWGDPGTDAIPPYYLSQVYFQLAVTGAARCYVPVIGPYLEFSEYVVEADIGFQDDILHRCKAFHDSLEADEPPELDGSVATYAAVRKSVEGIDKDRGVELTAHVAVELIEAKAGVEAAQSRDRLARSVVITEMGEAQFAMHNGHKIARRQANGFYPVAKDAAAITKPKGIAS